MNAPVVFAKRRQAGAVMHAARSRRAVPQSGAAPAAFPSRSHPGFRSMLGADPGPDHKQ